MGRIFHPIGENFRRFAVETLERKGADVPFKQNAVHVRTLLDDLR
jgi:hypothetical protein